MSALAPVVDRRIIDEFIDVVGAARWATRLRAIERQAALGPRAGKAVLRRHAVECTLERLRRGARPSVLEWRIGLLAGEAAALAGDLSARGRARWRRILLAALTDENTLIPAFHLIRTAAVHRARGFAVQFAGIEEAANFDLLLVRGGVEVELACDVISAEDGRSVHRGAWFRLADRIDPDLQTWLAAHPGRYLLKMTLPAGLRTGSEHDGEGELARLHARISRLLAESRRTDHDEALVLRLDPLLLAGAQADDVMISSLRREFGPEAHLAVVAAGGGVFVLAARAGRENDVAAAVRRRMAAIAPARLSGTRPGILAMFIEDTDREEWRGLRERLELEGEARQFLTYPAARAVVAVTCTSRLELFGAAEPDAAAAGEVRFRNPAHPAARLAALAPAVLSSI
ncbi:MAG TPA: hypothetical protein VFW75_07685 [Acetobacteraceae bacterium]|nr:hypothetical protein [Acetobacteraceae bacterium]